jgi:SPP1 gp7 family putative phage head morphogenesis protein
VQTKKPPQFGPGRRLEKEYEAGIRRVVERVLVPKEPGQTYAQWIAELVRRTEEADVQDAANTLAWRMVHWTSARNAKTWREAAERSQQSRKLYRLLQREMAGPTGSRVSRLVRENASLIRSLPLDVAERLNGEVLRAAQAGARPGTIAKMAKQRFPQLLRSRVQLIARTETAKTSTALTEARCLDLNLEWYEWLTSKDVRVRPSHLKMDGVLVNWSDPPSPETLVGEKSVGHYNSGSIWNCRCTQAPLLTFSDVSWPHRVYWQGSIRQMTLQEFKRIAQNVEERAA